MRLFVINLQKLKYIYYSRVHINCTNFNISFSIYNYYPSKQLFPFKYFQFPLLTIQFVNKFLNILSKFKHFFLTIAYFITKSIHFIQTIFKFINSNLNFSPKIVLFVSNKLTLFKKKTHLAY